MLETNKSNQDNTSHTILNYDACIFLKIIYCREIMAQLLGQSYMSDRIVGFPFPGHMLKCTWARN